jgi:hypothetical protein
MLNYNPNVPRITDSFAEWQPEFLMNFQQLFNAFSQNHVPLNAVSNAGNHNYIQLFEQTSPQQTNVGEFAIYTKEDESTTDQIFMRYQGNGTEFQFSCYQIYPISSTALQVPFFTFLPGKVICYFGLFNQTVSTPIQNQIILTPPIARNIISIDLTPVQTGTPSSVTLVTNKNRITTALTLSSPIPSVAPQSQYYVVLANI